MTQGRPSPLLAPTRSRTSPSSQNSCDRSSPRDERRTPGPFSTTGRRSSRLVGATQPTIGARPRFWKIRNTGPSCAMGVRVSRRVTSRSRDFPHALMNRLGVSLRLSVFLLSGALMPVACEGPGSRSSRPPKERVLGIPDASGGGIALRFRALADGGPLRVVEVTVGGVQRTVFWSREARAAVAFETVSSFSVENGRVVDDATGSVWTIEGRAIEGERSGERLSPLDEAYVAFWFAGAVFQPRTTVWSS